MSSIFEINCDLEHDAIMTEISNLPADQENWVWNGIKGLLAEAKKEQAKREKRRLGTSFESVLKRNAVR